MKVDTRLEPTADAAAEPRSRWKLGIDAAWAALPVLLPTFIILIGAMATIDMAYHVRTGDLIIAGRSLPRVDTYTFSVAGMRWVDQQWGAQLAMALAYRAGGFATLSLLRAALVSLTLGITYRSCRVRGASAAVSSGLSLAAMIVILQSVAMRPQLFALPLFAATMLVLVDRDRRPEWVWAIPAMTVAWANLHGSFIMAPALVGLAFLEDLMRHDRAGARRLVKVGLATVLSTFVTPFGPTVWSYALSLSMNPVIRGSVTEWRPIAFGSYAGGVFFLSSVAVAGWLARRGKPTPWPDLMWLGAFFVLALPAERGVLWWGLGAPVIMAALIPARSADGDGGGAEVTATRGSFLHLGVIVLLVALCAVALPYRRAGAPSSLLHGDPEGLVAAVTAEVQPGSHLLVPQPEASWFEFALPEDTVFVDSRIELFSTRIWDDYEKMRGGQDGWQTAMDRYRVDAVAFDPTSWPLNDAISRDPGWREAYRGPDGVLYVRAG